MKYLLIEDAQDKAKAICDFVNSIDKDSEISVAENLRDARVFILTKKYDLIIFDILLPDFSGAVASDISTEIISDFSRSQNCNSEAIAITKYVDEGIARSSLFNDNGVTVVNFSDENESWKKGLKAKIDKISNKARFDFLIFCALTKERSAYCKTLASLGDLKTISGLNCQELVIDGFRGMCITPARMGLVHMAITATKAIELFSPKIIAMSGICAGVQGESNFLDIIVGDICWEYQTGKFKDGEFKQEPYQVSISHALKTEFQQLSESPEFLAGLKVDIYDSELKESKILVGPVSSGSAVIADERKMAEIGLQHRKWLALEMEMYSLYEAASQSRCSPLFFGAKSVVDLGDASKGDSLHASASVLSARFVAEFLRKKLPEVAEK